MHPRVTLGLCQTLFRPFPWPSRTWARQAHSHNFWMAPWGYIYIYIYIFIYIYISYKDLKQIRMYVWHICNTTSCCRYLITRVCIHVWYRWAYKSIQLNPSTSPQQPVNTKTHSLDKCESLGIRSSNSSSNKHWKLTPLRSQYCEYRLAELRLSANASTVLEIRVHGAEDLGLTSMCITDGYTYFLHHKARTTGASLKRQNSTTAKRKDANDNAVQLLVVIDT